MHRHTLLPAVPAAVLAFGAEYMFTPHTLLVASNVQDGNAARRQPGQKEARHRKTVTAIKVGWPVAKSCSSMCVCSWALGLPCFFNTVPPLQE
jgi:hypothetical protein